MQNITCKCAKISASRPPTEDLLLYHTGGCPIDTSPSCIKWQRNVFASVYDCVLVTTSVVFQYPAGRVRGCMTLTKILAPICRNLLFKMHEIWSVNSQKKLLKLLPSDVRFYGSNVLNSRLRCRPLSWI